MNHLESGACHPHNSSIIQILEKKNEVIKEGAGNDSNAHRKYTAHPARWSAG